MYSRQQEWSRNESPARRLRPLLAVDPARPHDRRLFGPDDARENNGDDAAKKTKPATATAPPITDKQKGLLARLVEQQPEIAREIGIDPEEPGLEKLTKNEANPLIGKALERLKTEDIRLMNS